MFCMYSNSIIIKHGDEDDVDERTMTISQNSNNIKIKLWNRKRLIFKMILFKTIFVKDVSGIMVSVGVDRWVIPSHTQTRVHRNGPID